jgi:two-component system, sensor histidine kinase
MSASLPFFNWSVKKLLDTEPDAFTRAKIRILITVLVFSLIKLLVALFISHIHNQDFQVGRSLVMLAIYIALLKLILYNRLYMRPIAHTMVWLGLLLIWSNTFITAKSVNIITLQFVFMLYLSSFYLLGRTFGIIYSILGALPVLIYMLMGNDIVAHNFLADQLASPGYEIIIVLNFITVVVSHYLFHEAFSANITEKEVLNRQLQAAVKEANDAAQSKSNFLSTMSHELRTPLNSVIGMTELLMDDSPSDAQKENLKILNFSAVSLHSLINDILDFNKLGSDKIKLEELGVNLHKLLSNICAGLRVQAKEKGLSLVLKVDDDIKNKRVLTDPTRITQILYNLTGNAIKFTPKGKVTVALKVLSKADNDIMVRFSVTDTGIGIHPDNHKSIFEAFMQASTSTTRDFGGTGLGLAIVKRLLTLFDSKINLESKPGVGSHFFFDIRFFIDHRTAPDSITHTEATYNLAGLRVLVAEDNPMNRLLLKKVFSKWNVEPVFAVNGQEAVQKILSGDYDVVLMDIHMPVLDGYKAARAIRKMVQAEKNSIPIIALTASVSNNLNEKITEAGMNDYIYKPFNSKELYTKMKEISERSKLQLSAEDQPVS